MVVKEAITPARLEYLQAVCRLTGCEAKKPVSFEEIREYLGFGEDESERCCDFWTNNGALAWTTYGHVALTHAGATRAGQLAGEEVLSSILGPASARPETELAPHMDRGNSEQAVVSVVIPVLNEALTIEALVRTVSQSPQVLEVLAVDDGSIDGTTEVAARAGAVVVTSSMLGKGASMEDGLRAASGEIVLFVDGDLLEIPRDLVERMTDPIRRGEADLVEARFTTSSNAVTILTARPLLSAFFPELAGFSQPLGGIMAVRRSLLGNIRLENDYAVDIALLIDAVSKGAKVIEVDIGHVDHETQPLEAQGDIAKQVTRVILERAWRYERLNINQVLHMQEIERRARAQSLPATCATPSSRLCALFDMDGVLLDGDFVVELAARVGVESDLAHLMNSGVLSDEERSRAIAALFVGVSVEVFEETALAIPLMTGAVETIVGLRQAGYRVGIVTDSFHLAAEIVRRRVFADFCVAHVLHFRNGAATGEITPAPAMVDPRGCRDHSCCQSNVARFLETTSGVDPKHTLAVGNGDNYRCMLSTAGMSVAFRPRSDEVEHAAQYCIRGSLLEILDLVDAHPGPEAGDRVSTAVSPPPSVEAWSSRRAEAEHASWPPMLT